MVQKICRCCGAEIKDNPILSYSDMPGMAQNFPDETELERDHGVDLDLYQCPYCGMIQIVDEPVPYYKDVIRASAVSDEMKVYRRTYFKDFVDKYHLQGKKVIEIGSGKGEFLSLMNEAGVEGYGVEHCQENVEACTEKGLNVQQGYMDCVGTLLENAPFEGFFIMNFLEHAPNPNDFLKAIYENLAEGAIGLVEVPNTDFILENLMFSEFITDHLLYFTENTLRILLEKNGFEVLECNVVWHNYCLAAIVRKKKILKLGQFYERQDKITKEIQSFVNRYDRVAVWGAGHQALAVIALTGIKDQIRFVVDSASFKQNKYTPGTHLKIVAPEQIRLEKIDAVLVMAASYSDEVAQIITDQYPNVKIAILREEQLEYIQNLLSFCS
ncbi:MAG: class I SAM-dependent methyltransferase [Lachnospiraceae bacterium]|nr:class I SAM-dependent methyltransferase [Lachnospiraceae bacterium]